MLTPPTLVRLAVRAGVSGLVAVALLGAAAPARATPWAAPSSAALQDATSSASAPAPAPSTGPTTAPPSTGGPTSIDGALEAGDLTAAKSLAQAARKAEPTAAAWQREGQVLEQTGDYREAAKAYRAAKKAAGEDAAAIAAAQQGLVRVKASARGTVADEPVSTHRDELDPRWEPPRPTELAPQPEPEPEPEPRDGDRIVTKWYFWVTVGAIAASAAAVTAIAIKAARDDQPDALDSFTPAPASRGFGALRF